MTHPRLIMMSNRTEKSSPTQDKTFRERGGTTDTQQAKLDSVQKLVWKNRARLLFTRFSHYFCEQFNTASPDGAGGAERSRAAGGRKRPPLPAADLGRQRSEESLGSEQTLLPHLGPPACSAHSPRSPPGPTRGSQAPSSPGSGCFSGTLWGFCPQAYSGEPLGEARQVTQPGWRARRAGRPQHSPWLGTLLSQKAQGGAEASGAGNSRWGLLPCLCGSAVCADRLYTPRGEAPQVLL